MYFDYTYLVFVLPALLFAMIARGWVKSSYSKYSKISNSREMTGRDAAIYVLQQNGVLDVSIVPVSGNLTDNFDPRTNTIHLSEGVYNSTSVAAVGIAGHEAGHAVQYAMGYSPIKLRNAIIPVTNIGSKLAIPLFIAGLLLSSYWAKNFILISYIGILCFGLSTLFQLLTLPAEINASRRAVRAMESINFAKDEIVGTKKVLTAAAMTYVAALAVSLMQLLRLLIIAGRRRE